MDFIASVTTPFTVPVTSSFEPMSSSVLWILIVSFVVAFFLAFGVGANDVANSFGTSVGSKVLTLRQACVLATIFEILGAVSLGYGVSETIRTGMIYIDDYKSEEKLLMVGYLSALFGSSLWNIFATLFALPVSGTHSIVGAIIGFSVVAKGFESVKWPGLIRIVVSWFISPVLSGVISLLLYLLIRFIILSRTNSLSRGLISLPFFYGFTIFINVFSVLTGAPKISKDLTWWMAVLIGLAIGFVVGLIVWFVIVPRLRRKILSILEKLKNVEDFKNNAVKVEMFTIEEKTATNGVENNHSPPKVNGFDFNSNKSTLVYPGEVKTGDFYNSEKDVVEVADGEDDDKPDVAQLFTFLQILTACFGSFAHGANDVSNAIGPLVAVMMIYKDGNQSGYTPWYILLYGGVAISIGLWAWGRRVIETMGKDLTKITPSTGFTIEIGSALTVLLATKVGIPVSTTHCKVGSVVMVGKARKSKQGVNWRLFGNISIAWVLTVPITALFSAFAMWLLMMVI